MNTIDEVKEPVPATVPKTTGEEMYSLIEELYPICRSITGNGVRQTLDIIRKHIPIVMHEVPTGTKVFDWEVPREWNIRDAYIKDSRGEKIIDFADSNLHVLNYSVPVYKTVSLSQLKNHLHTAPETPGWIPYRTSYYKEDWGFCLSHDQFQRLEDDFYQVYIDSTLSEGHLTYAEYYIQGTHMEEVLISVHICHPSLCNDNLSGISVAVFLARELQKRRLRYSYRFLFIPGTIGAITWLSINEAKTKNIRHGLVATLLGNEGDFIYKRSRRGNAEIDQVVEEALKDKGVGYEVVDFTPYGYDERQFCSPGFNLPVGSLSRARYGQFPEYHTSADNLSLVTPEALSSSLAMYSAVMEMLEANKKYVNLNSKCEPNLGKRGLYSLTGSNNANKDFQLALLWVLNLSDGVHTLLDISRRSKMKFSLIKEAADKLVECRLLIGYN